MGQPGAVWVKGAGLGSEGLESAQNGCIWWGCGCECHVCW